MTTLKQLRVVIASPSDVKEEREAVVNVIGRVNNHTAEGLGLILKPLRWETDAYPGFHIDGPQGLIDSSLQIEDCDILIGIIWKRFGTPTKDGKTGTEHEFYKAYEAWKRNKKPHIMMYFSQKHYYPKDIRETEQQREVLRFKENIPKEALYWEYRSLEKFKETVGDHLTQYIQQTFKIKSSEPKEQEHIEQPTEEKISVEKEAHQNKSITVNAQELIENRIKFKLYAAEHHLENLIALEQENEMMSRFEGRIKWEIEIEGFLFQLIGVRNAILFRINDRMGFKLSNTEVTLINVKNLLNALNKKSLLRIIKVFEDTSNWFSDLNELYESTLRKLINIHVKRGGSDPGVYLVTDPQTELQVIPYLEDSIHKMRDLVEDIKNSEPALAL